MSCPGGCQELCGVEYELECCEGSSLQSAQGSTQDVEEAGTQSAIRDEWVRNVRPNNHTTVALDWARVGGVVQEGWGVCKTDVNRWEPKYVPDWDHLSVLKKSSLLIETIKHPNIIYEVKFCHQPWLTRCFLAREIKKSKNTFQVNPSVQIMSETFYQISYL